MALRRSPPPGLGQVGAHLGAGLFAGLACGVVVGGLGGRLAMLVLRLTSDSVVRGQRTDDGFVIGQLSRATGFLVFLTAVLGAVGGLFYLVIRPCLPRGRALLMGGLAAVVGGAVIVEPGRGDFATLEPRWLAAGFFVAIPGLYGVAVSLVAERLLARTTPAAGSQWWATSLPFATLVLLGPPGIVLGAVLVGGWAVGRRLPRALAWAGSARAHRLGRAALVVIAAAAGVDLVGNVNEILELATTGEMPSTGGNYADPRRVR